MTTTISNTDHHEKPDAPYHSGNRNGTMVPATTTNSRTVKEDSWQEKLKKHSQAAWNKSTN